MGFWPRHSVFFAKKHVWPMVVIVERKKKTKEKKRGKEKEKRKKEREKGKEKKRNTPVQALTHRIHLRHLSLHTSPSLVLLCIILRFSAIQSTCFALEHRLFQPH